MTDTNRAYNKEESSLIKSKTYQSKMNYDKDYFSLITSESELAELEKVEEEFNESNKVEKEFNELPIKRQSQCDKQYFEIYTLIKKGGGFPKQFPKNKREQRLNSQRELLKERIDLSDPPFDVTINFTPNYANYSTDLY